MEERYVYSREAILNDLRHWPPGQPLSLEELSEHMLREVVDDDDVTWARRTARRWGFGPPITPESPMLEQQLAMDT